MVTYIADQKTKDIDFIIKDFYNNYFYNNTISYNKLYINNLINVNNKTSYIIYKDVLVKYLLENKNVMSKKVKEDDYSFSEFYNFIEKYYNKITLLKDFATLLLDDTNIIFNNFINCPILIKFFENNLIKEMIKGDVSSKEFPPLCLYFSEKETRCSEEDNNIKSILCVLRLLLSQVNYKWIIDKYSMIMFMNYPKFTNNIPKQYQILYQFKLLQNYIHSIYVNLKAYKSIFADLYNQVYICFDNMLDNCTLYQINNTINNYENFMNYIFHYISQKKNNEPLNLLNMCLKLAKNLNNDDHGNFFELLKLINNIGKYTFYYYLILEDVKFVNKFIEFIHNYIYNESDFILSTILKTMVLYSNVKVEKNKELFLKLYHEKIIIRLLSNNYNIYKEIRIVNIINEYFYKSFELNKINNVIHDKELNLIYNRKFVEDINTDLDTNPNIITLSYSNWNINFDQGTFTINNESNTINNESSTKNLLYKYIYSYNNSYEILNNHKKTLLWLLHQGEIIIEYIDKDIKMLPLQFLIFDIIYNNEVEMKDILTNEYLINYSDHFKKNVINSLVISNLIILDKDILKLNHTDNFETNLVAIFHKYNHKLIEKKIYKLDTDTILKCNINYFVKKNPLDINQLLKKCQDKFNNIDINIELISKVINKMILQDYLILKDGIYHKLF
jgi:hypothetical protein